MVDLLCFDLFSLIFYFFIFYHLHICRNLACNNFSANIPYNLTFMKNLRHLWVACPMIAWFASSFPIFIFHWSSSCRNLSHNSLSGPIGNVFDGLLNLKQMYAIFINVVIWILCGALSWCLNYYEYMTIIGCAVSSKKSRVFP